MAKMTQDMNGAVGKLGNRVYYSQNGQTVVRVNTTPKNPKTNAQTIQRVIMKQVNKSYKMFKEICNHSFEGVTTGIACMNRFMQLNAKYLRNRAAEIQQSGQSLSAFYNFSPITSEAWAPGAAILAQGSLPQVQVDLPASNYAAFPATENTYAGVCDALGAKRGDQLTLVTVFRNQFGSYQVKLARIILDPRNADGSGASMASAFVGTNGAVNLPNFRNETDGAFLSFADYSVRFNLDSDFNIAAAAVILSRRDKEGYWFRSNAQLVINESVIGSDLCSLQEAVDDSYASADIYSESDLYLNNAGTGGSQGSSEAGTEPGLTPVFSDSVLINGSPQNVSGGVVALTSGAFVLTLRGQNLLGATPVVTNAGTAIQPATQSDTAITYNIPADWSDVRVRKSSDGSQWFRLAVANSGLEQPDQPGTPSIASITVGGEQVTLYPGAATDELVEGMLVGFNGQTGEIVITGSNLGSIRAGGDAEIALTINEDGTRATGVTTGKHFAVYNSDNDNVYLAFIFEKPVVSVAGETVELNYLGGRLVGDASSRGQVVVTTQQPNSWKLGGEAMTPGMGQATGTWSEGDEITIQWDDLNLITLMLA